MIPSSTIYVCLTLGLASASSLCNNEESAVSKSSLLQVSRHATNISRSGISKVNETDPYVCIIARVCGENTECAPGDEREKAGIGSTPEAIVRSFLASWPAQSYPHWELHLINGEGGGEVYSNLVEEFKDERLMNGPSAPEKFEDNTWGYEATNYAYDEVKKSSKKPCSYFLFTNGDNLYGRFFLETGLPGMEKGLDLLGFNFVSRYWQNGDKPNKVIHNVSLEVGHIDLGAVLVSANAMEESGLKFDLSLPWWLRPELDWEFFKRILARPGYKGSEVYEELQYIHQ